MKSKKFLSLIGNILICLSLFFLYLTFSQPIKEETKYRARQITTRIIPVDTEEKEVEPVNTDFSMVIPKISATAPIIDKVDSSDPLKFMPALSKGVAHAIGSSYPGEEGNVYLFAHSTDAFFNFNRYNAVFYLLGKLNKGDEVYLYYKNTKYIYIVSDKAIVNADEIDYLYRNTPKKILTLQTCYPPGTDLKRLIVLAEIQQ